MRAECKGNNLSKYILNWNDKVVCIASSPVCLMGMQFLCSRRVYREKEKKCTD